MHSNSKTKAPKGKAICGNLVCEVTENNWIGKEVFGNKFIFKVNPTLSELQNAVIIYADIAAVCNRFLCMTRFFSCVVQKTRFLPGKNLNIVRAKKHPSVKKCFF